MDQWAENEVKLACKREAPDRKEGEWDYGCACYESALKAYNSLLDDDHSGLSWSFTRGILNRLMHGKPLTPIEEGDIWNFDAVNTNLPETIKAYGYDSRKIFANEFLDDSAAEGINHFRQWKKQADLTVHLEGNDIL